KGWTALLPRPAIQRDRRKGRTTYSQTRGSLNLIGSESSKLRGGHPSGGVAQRVRITRRVSAQELHSSVAGTHGIASFQRWHVTCQSNAMSHWQGVRCAPEMQLKQEQSR